MIIRDGTRNLLLAGAILSGVAILPVTSTAATIDSWNTTNVDVGPAVTEPNTGASVIYDRDVTAGVPAGAVTNGQVVYTAPEANTPGVKVVQENYNVFSGCLMTSSAATCTSPFQSGKRIKQQVTDAGPIDLTFDVSADQTGQAIYQVFHRLINTSGQLLESFDLQLGVGVGDDFVESGSGDGLRFATNDDGVEFGPNNLAAFSQYPFGLFGGEPLNPNPLQLPGFFDTESRAGFDVVLDEDSISSDGYYGTYDDRFGNWLPQQDVPEGILYDFDPGNADPLVMAWADELGWEFLRGTYPDSILNDLGVEPISSVFFEYDFENDPLNGISGSMLEYMMANLLDPDGNSLDFGTDLIVDAIEDLANLNTTFAIVIDDAFAGANSTFTLRASTSAVAPIPLPAGAPLLLIGLSALGLLARRKSKAA